MEPEIRHNLLTSKLSDALNESKHKTKQIKMCFTHVFYNYMCNFISSDVFLSEVFT